MVHFASRLDHVEHMIRPALDAGMIVVCDRFYDSTLAYQGYGLGQGDSGCLAFIDRLIGLVGLTPDLTLLLAIPRDLALARLQQRGTRSDRYERLDEAFHQRVAGGFREIARQAGTRVVTIPATGSAQQVHKAMLHEVDQRFPA
jgi:dTMP kinase